MLKLVSTLFILLFYLIVIGCTKNSNNQIQNMNKVQDEKSISNENYSQKSTLNLTIEPRITKGLQGDFTNVSFSIQSKPWTPIIKGKVNCILHEDLKATCNIIQSLDKLKDGGAYRILIFDNKRQNSDGLACDYFIYSKSKTPNLIVSPSSTGECILWQLKLDTGYDEQEIRNRVRHILNGKDTEEYDLEMTLYDLYRYCDSDYGWNEAWKELVKLIQSNKPLPKSSDSQIDGAGKLFQ